METVANGLGGAVAFVIGGLLIIFCIFWTFFPIIVWSELRKIRQTTDKLGKYFSDRPVEVDGQRYE